MQPLQKGIQHFLRSTGQYLHPPVSQVYRVSRDSKAPGLLSSGISKKNALNTTANQNLDTLIF